LEKSTKEGLAMKNTIKKTIEMLKDKVKGNLTEIQSNQKEIRNLLKQPASAERSVELEEKYALNKVLLAENNDFINVQLTLSNFLDKYSNSEVLEGVMVPGQALYRNENECFDLTVNGKLTYNQNHPFYNDDKFFHKLLTYYQNVEDYEACHELVKNKNQK
jgi:hypothetical protein